MAEAAAVFPSLPEHPVVVTRPVAQAAPFADRLRQAGFAPVLFPLLQILPAADLPALRLALSGLQRHALVVFVSPNAVDAVFDPKAGGLHGWPRDVAIGIVGEGSRAALARHGVDAGNATIFAPRDPAKSDSDELFKALDLAALGGRSVLIVRGQAGRDFLTDALRAEGIAVEHVAAYRRMAPALDQACAALLRGLLARDSCWIVTSSEALRHLHALAGALAADGNVANQQHQLRQQALLVSHRRIADCAQELGFVRITLTGSGDECLLAALQSRP